MRTKFLLSMVLKFYERFHLVKISGQKVEEWTSYQGLILIHRVELFFVFCVSRYTKMKCGLREHTIYMTSNKLSKYKFDIFMYPESYRITDVHNFSIKVPFDLKFLAVLNLLVSNILTNFQTITSCRRLLFAQWSCKDNIRTNDADKTRYGCAGL